MPKGKRSKSSGKGMAKGNGGTVPAMREPSDVIAVLLSDIHLSLKAPRCRIEEDWLATTAGYLKQVGALAAKYDAPIICVGDIFDYWKAEPELINFALEYLPSIYAIPGQHDLPLHSMELMKRSAYWTMAMAGKIYHLEGVFTFPDFTVHTFQWGEKITPCPSNTKGVHLAIAHQYVWTEGHSYPGAPEEAQVSGLKKCLKGYTAAAFGDNHKGFLSCIDGCWVFNCGGFMRRKIDERNYDPTVGLLGSCGQIFPWMLNTTEDRIVDPIEDTLGVDSLDVREFLMEMKKLKGKTFDFREAMEAAFISQKVSPPVQKIILEAMA